MHSRFFFSSFFAFSLSLFFSRSLSIDNLFLLFNLFVFFRISLQVINNMLVSKQASASVWEQAWIWIRSDRVEYFSYNSLPLLRLLLSFPLDSFSHSSSDNNNRICSGISIYFNSLKNIWCMQASHRLLVDLISKQVTRHCSFVRAIVSVGFIRTPLIELICSNWTENKIKKKIMHTLTTQTCICEHSYFLQTK